MKQIKTEGELIGATVLFMGKSWRYSEAFQKKYPCFFPLQSKNWRYMVPDVNKFVVDSLDDIWDIKNFILEVLEEEMSFEKFHVWYASPIYKKVRASDGNQKLKLSEVKFYDFYDLENATFVVDRDTYDNLTKLTDTLDGRPIIYEESMDSVIKAGFRTFAFDIKSDGWKKLEEYVTQNAPSDSSFRIYIVYFTHGQKGVTGFHHRITEITR